MANLVTLCGSLDDSIKMSNGLTQMFVEMLALAGTALAQTDHQRDLVVWLASHDQAVTGRGTTDLDLCTMPFTDLEADRAFLTSAARAALARKGWASLAYQPNSESVARIFPEFISLLGQLELSMVPERIAEAEDLRSAPAGYPTCRKHGCLLHRYGCVICNDESTNPPSRVAD